MTQQKCVICSRLTKSSLASSDASPGRLMTETRVFDELPAEEQELGVEHRPGCLENRVGGDSGLELIGHLGGKLVSVSDLTDALR